MVYAKMDKNELIAEHQAFPNALSAAAQNPDAEKLAKVVWSELELKRIRRPFDLPRATSSYDTLSHFIETEVRLQMEIMRSNIHHKVCMVGRLPRDATENRKAEKHLRIILPKKVTARTLSLNLDKITREPLRGMFTNYVFLFQTRIAGGGDSIENLCLAFCTQMQKKNGANFDLGKDADKLYNLPAGTVIYARPLMNRSMWKAHIRAIAALKEVEASLQDSHVASQLLRGCIDAQNVKKIDDVDTWIKSELQEAGSRQNMNLQEFNQQQQRALALDALTSRGLVIIQGPPGTGKSHTICHGILPQAVARNERVLVVCNSNVAIDALLLKCFHGDSPKLKGKMRRCGFKGSVSDEVVDLGIYVEGDVSSIRDEYGNTAGSNSNTVDDTVQYQIRSAQVVFTTIHFASKEKTASVNSAGYWNFDTLILDEAAQIEDSRLMIMLARCHMLKKIILVGDPKQLQPYVPDSLRDQSYGRSTMERVMETSSETRDLNGLPYVMLEEQFRMAPPLRSLVSHLYYNGRLQDADCVLKNGLVSKTAGLKHLLVVNVTGTTMEYSSMHNSFENKAEADIVKVIYDFIFGTALGDALLKDRHLTSNDVCILTPYNRHKDRLRMNICNVSEDSLDTYAGQTFSKQTPVKSGGDTKSNRYSSTPSFSPKKSQALFGTQDEIDVDTAAMVENIDTVDKFQGSERKVVIISTCVHDKPRRAADPHFINVACSRSQHLLIIVGNFTSGLAGNSDWEYIKSQALVNGSYIDHEVTVKNIDASDGVSYDINEDSIKEKLEELVGRPMKKGRKIDF